MQSTNAEHACRARTSTRMRVNSESLYATGVFSLTPLEEAVEVADALLEARLGVVMIVSGVAFIRCTGASPVGEGEAAVAGGDTIVDDVPTVPSSFMNTPSVTSIASRSLYRRVNTWDSPR